MSMPVCALCRRYITGESVIIHGKRKPAKQVHKYCATIEGYNYLPFDAKVNSTSADKSSVSEVTGLTHNED